MYNYDQLNCFYPGQELYEREELLKTVELIPIGTKLYKSGGFAGSVELITVTDLSDSRRCTMFFNSIYFNNFEEAQKATDRAHAEYGEYQAQAADMWYNYIRNQ